MHTTVCLGGYSNSLSTCFCWDSLEIAQRSGVCSAARGRQLPLPQNQWPCLQWLQSGFRGGGWSSSFTTPMRPKSNATAARQVLSKGQNQTNPVYIDSGRTSQPTWPSAPTAAPQDLLWRVSRRRPEASISTASTGCHNKHLEKQKNHSEIFTAHHYCQKLYSHCLCPKRCQRISTLIGKVLRNHRAHINTLLVSYLKYNAGKILVFIPSKKVSDQS